MNLNKEEILFFIISVILLFSVFTDYVNDLIIAILIIMIIWMNRIIKRRNKS